MTADKHRIELYLRNERWFASDTDPEVTELFGTSDLETPYSSSTEPQVILNTITKLNPNKIVRLRDHSR